MSESNLWRTRPFLDVKDGHIVWCKRCGAAVYRNNPDSERRVVWVGQGAVRDGDGSLRADKEEAMCPPCAGLAQDERWQEELKRRAVGARAIAKLIESGAPQWEIDVAAVKWGFETSDVVF